MGVKKKGIGGVGNKVLLLGFFVDLEFELRSSHLLGRSSIALATPPALFCDGFFEMGS
jgi:hypothetical protein